MKPSRRAAVVMAFAAAILSSCSTLRAPRAYRAVLRHALTADAAGAYQLALNAWGEGRQEEAEYLLSVLVERYPTHQRLAFFRAACARSRWNKTWASDLLVRTRYLGPGTPEGQCAYLVLVLDEASDVEENFERLRALVKAHPEDPLLLWMIAIQCREHDRNQEGVGYYEQLLGKLAVGSSLVHQTYANLLEEVGRLEDAMVHRHAVVALEPAGWAFNSYAVTLNELGRYEEAEAYYQEALLRSPDVPRHWRNLGSLLKDQERFDEAIDAYERALSLSPRDPVTQYHVADCLAKMGRHEEALSCYLEAAYSGNAYAARRAARCFRRGLGARRNDALAASWYRAAADMGDRRAMYQLGWLYAEGNGVSRNDEQSFSWFARAASKEHVNAMARLGYMYNNGIGVQQDFDKAMEWSRKAADAGSAWGMYHIGIFYAYARGVAQDYPRAREWLLLAAELGHENAMAELGFMYINGYGVETNYHEALAWSRKAAEHGSAQAMYNLGYHYRYGLGVEEDHREAMRWFELAGEKGWVAAMDYLGWGYASGRGVPKDVKKSVEWFQRAAEGGSSYAMFELGCTYGYGKGIPRDHAKAITWWEKAVAADHYEAMNALAWLLVTCPEPEYLDGEKAVALALSATAQYPLKQEWIDTLAAAYARNGDFAEAVAAQRRAISLSVEGESSEQEIVGFEERLDMYGNNRAYTQP